MASGDHADDYTAYKLLQFNIKYPTFPWIPREIIPNKSITSKVLIPTYTQYSSIDKEHR